VTLDRRIGGAVMGRSQFHARTADVFYSPQQNGPHGKLENIQPSILGKTGRSVAGFNAPSDISTQIVTDLFFVGLSRRLFGLDDGLSFTPISRMHNPHPNQNWDGSDYN
jgi:hypothetical protein